MKATILISAFLLLAPSAALAQGARLQLDQLDRLASLAAETVNLTIDPEMLRLASAFIKGDGDQSAVKEMLDGLTGIYVRSFEFEREHAYTPEDVNTIRNQLMTPGWSRLVTVDGRRERELVEIYSWREGQASGGLAILVAEPRELTVVNIVGSFDLAKLGALQGSFGIPRIPLDSQLPR